MDKNKNDLSLNFCKWLIKIQKKLAYENRLSVDMLQFWREYLKKIVSSGHTGHTSNTEIKSSASSKIHSLTGRSQTGNGMQPVEEWYLSLH